MGEATWFDNTHLKEQNSKAQPFMINLLWDCLWLYNYVYESLLEDAPKLILIPETKEISNEYESLDRSYILNDDIFAYIVAHEMIERNDIEPCSVEECQQEQIGLNAIQDNYIIW